MSEPQSMYTPAQVAALYGVDSKTVTRWARQGKLISAVTPNGHRRFPSGQFRDVNAARQAAQAMEDES